jgi:hypothetical protein
MFIHSNLYRKVLIMLSRRLVLLFVVLGAVFWFSGVLTVRLFNDAVFSAGNPLLILMFVLAFPITLVFIWIAKIASGLRYNELVVPTTIMTFTALFLDGSIIAFAPQFYAPDQVTVMHGAGFIMWGGAVGLFIAWWLSLRGHVNT